MSLPPKVHRRAPRITCDAPDCGLCYAYRAKIPLFASVRTVRIFDRAPSSDVPVVHALGELVESVNYLAARRPDVALDWIIAVPRGQAGHACSVAHALGAARARIATSVYRRWKP